MDIFDRIRWWCVRHQTQIGCFNIGALSVLVWYNLSRGDFVSVLLNIILIAINYSIVR
jgi:hypothetical protein